MKIVFAGTPQLAVTALDALVEAGHEIVLALTRPDRPQGRGLNVAPPPLKVRARELGIEVLQPAKLSLPEVAERIAVPDAGVVAAYKAFIPRSLLGVPAHGWLNVHPSLLPKYRGPSPVKSAILNGETVTGVTIIRLTPEMDSGPIILQERLDILEDENAGQLYERLASLGARLIVEALALLESGRASFREQDHSAATLCGAFSKKDGIIDWSRDNVVNIVRAMTPWPGARGAVTSGATGRTTELLITAARRLEETSPGEPGRIARIEKGGIVVRAGGGDVLVTRVKPAGKKEMAAHDFANGYRISAGDIFGKVK